MEVLFKHLQRRQLNTSLPAEGNKQILLFEQIASQKGHIETLTVHIKAWMDWFKDSHPDSALPVTPLTEEKKQEAIEHGTTAQPFLLQSDEGQYLVLHRLNEVAPQECISWLKKNGPESFKNRLSATKMCFDPCIAGTNSWNPVDNETSKRFVHQFFNSKN
jgi:hypothetical protein|tara:strand:- start:90 stop:572 length:483 start_codon:yes stop_codon:yes gene_type:complete